MSQACQGKPYKITQEGEVVVGSYTSTYGNSSTYGTASTQSQGSYVGQSLARVAPSLGLGQVTNRGYAQSSSLGQFSANGNYHGASSTTDQTEWRIEFECQ